MARTFGQPTISKTYICDICGEKTFMEFSDTGKGTYCFICYDKHIIEKQPIKKGF